MFTNPKSAYTRVYADFSGWLQNQLKKSSTPSTTPGHSLLSHDIFLEHALLPKEVLETNILGSNRLYG